MKQTPDVAQALVNLRASRDFQEVLKWFKEWEAKELHSCVKQDGLLLYRAQGAVEVLQTIEKVNAEAPDTLEKFK